MSDRQFTIDAADDDIRLDRWFKRHYPALSHGDLQKAMRKGLIRIDGKKTEASTRILAGQSLTVKFLDLDAARQPIKPKKGKTSLTPEQVKETQSWVLFRNPQVIALNKPAGIAVQGGSGVKDHVDGRLSALCFEEKDPPKLVHRLDKDTSGVLLLGRSAKAAAELSRAFASKRMRKIYWALVIGVPEIYEGEIEGALEKSQGDYEKMEVDEDGKPAITRYRVIEHLGSRMAWMELEPVTGRTHQLRVHMAQMGHPIVGDGKYGGKDAFIGGSMDLPKQLHLHARQVQLPGLSGGDLDITAPLPEHMKHSFKLLGLAE